MSAAGSTATVFDIKVVTRAIVLKTAEAMNVSVKLNDPFAPRAQVEAVDVLSNEQEFWGALFHFGQGQMTSVRLRVERLLASPGVPIGNEFGIPSKGLGGGELFRFEFAPEPGLGVTKSSEPAFGRNSGAGKCNNFLCPSQVFE